MPPAELAAWLQLAAIVVGLATVLVKIGGKDQSLRQNTHDIRELSAIVRDLVRSQVESETRHDALRDTLNDLKFRLDRMESSRWGSGIRSDP